MFLRGALTSCRESHETYVPAQSPPSPTDPRFPGPHANQEWSHRAEASARQGTETTHGFDVIASRRFGMLPRHVREIPSRGPASVSRSVRSRAARRSPRIHTSFHTGGITECPRRRSARDHRVPPPGWRCRQKPREAADSRSLPSPVDAGSLITRARSRSGGGGAACGHGSAVFNG